MKRIFIGLFGTLLLLAEHCFGGTLTGFVRDSKGNPLPFATVFVAGTTNGTTANGTGQYQLSLPAGNYVVTCQYIGYQQTTFNLNVGQDEQVKHDFKLIEQTLEMKEVVVRASDEDPAYRIIREAIRKREFHLKQVKEFQTSIYLKGVLRTRSFPNKIMGLEINGEDKKEIGLDTAGKGVVYLCEEVADYYSAPGDKQRTVIHSVRESGEPNGFGLSSMPPVISFYENNVASFTGSRGLISPIASNALSFYKYRLEGEFKESRNTIYKIKVIPKRAYEPLVFGYIYIVDGDWAIHSLSLTTTSRYGLAQLDTLRLDQIFLPLKKDVWVIKSQQVYPTLGFMGIDFTGNFVTVYDNQKVNEPMPDSIFAKKIISTYDKAANQKDTTYWEDTRPLPLETDERRDYQFRDSMTRVTNDPDRKDSLRRLANRLGPLDLIYPGYAYYDSGYKNGFKVQPLIASVNFNNVEGLNIAPQLSWQHKLDSANRLELHTAFRYGITNTHFNAIGALAYVHRSQEWRGRSLRLTAEGGKYVFQYDRNNPVSPLFNTITSLIFNYNPLKIYERWTGAVYARQNFGNGLRWWARAAFEHRMPLENSTDYTWGNEESEYHSSNLPASLTKYMYQEHDAVVAKAGLSWQPGYRYIQYPDHIQSVPSGWPVFSVQYERGIPNLLGSNVDWDKWYAGVTGRISLKLFGSIEYSVSGQGFFNRAAVGLPDLIHPFAGDDIFFNFASPYMSSFNLAPLYEFSNDAEAFGEVHIEYNLMGLLTNKIPGLRQAKWYLILGTNSFYAREDLYFSEVFFSIDNLGYKVLRLLRVDFLHGWDAQGRQYDGIRMGLKLPIAEGLKNRKPDLEW
jgi:hypothetical protein